MTPGTDNEGDSSDDDYGHIRLLTENVDALLLATDSGSEFHGKTSISRVLSQAAQEIPSLSQAVRNISQPCSLPSRRPIFWATITVNISYTPIKYSDRFLI